MSTKELAQQTYKYIDKTLDEILKSRKEGTEKIEHSLCTLESLCINVLQNLAYIIENE